MSASAPEPPDLATLVELESRVWTALVQGDTQADEQLLAADFLGVYATGFANRDEHAGQLAAGPVVASFALSQARLLDLGPDTALLSYLATWTRPGAPAPQRMFISSIWRRRDGRWRNVFSQDTPAAP